jgi:hypothetical protein
MLRPSHVQSVDVAEIPVVLLIIYKIESDADRVLFVFTMLIWLDDSE